MNDDELLDALEDKLQLIRDRTRGVADGYSNGFLLWGEGGISKSFTVEETLKSLGKPYRLTNSRLSGKGLFDLLRDRPDAVHVLEDVETLFGDKTAHGVLRSALWGQQGRDGRQERLVVWQTAREREEFIFAGGIIMVSNARLADIPELRAIRTRIPCFEYAPSDEEVAAKMRDIARRGHRLGPHTLTPAACLEVAEAIIERSSRLANRLDLRLLVNSFADRLQWEHGAAKHHWLELLDSRMRERSRPQAPPASGGRADRKQAEQDIARDIQHLPAQQRLEEWKARTGKSQAALYRRLEEVKSGVLTLPEK